MYKLLVPRNSPGFVNTQIWRPYIEKHFTIVNMEEDDDLSNYDPKDHIYIQTHAVNAILEAEQVLNAGFRMILDYTWDHHGKGTSSGNVFLFKTNDFILANEILAYKAFGYDKLTFNQNKSKFILCLMNQIRQHRDRLFNALAKFKADSLISYVERNVRLTGDKDRSYQDIYIGAPSWERHSNLDWYTTTNISVVAETDAWIRDFISEKSFKPFAFKHPLIVYGPYKILKRIRSVGFQTYDNIINESYDDILHQLPRLEAIKLELDRLYKEFKKHGNMFTDTETQRRIDHNFNLFYSDSLLNNIINKQIIDPIMEFACQPH